MTVLEWRILQVLYGVSAYRKGASDGRGAQTNWLSKTGLKKLLRGRIDTYRLQAISRLHANGYILVRYISAREFWITLTPKGVRAMDVFYTHPDFDRLYFESKEALDDIPL